MRRVSFGSAGFIRARTQFKFDLWYALGGADPDRIRNFVPIQNQHDVARIAVPQSFIDHAALVTFDDPGVPPGVVGVLGGDHVNDFSKELLEAVLVVKKKRATSHSPGRFL